MARKARQSDEGGLDPNGWMVTFSDLITLLLTFFVLLLSMSSMDTKIVKTFFTIFKGATGPLELSEQGEVSAIRHVVEQLRDTMVSPAELDSDTLRGLLFKYQSEEGQPLRGRMTGDDLEVVESRRGVRLRFKDRVFFDAGSAELRAEALPVLERLGEVVRHSRFRVSVEGHTDNAAIHTARFPSNWELSLARAVEVVSFVSQEGNLSANRFRVGGFGPSRPLVPNSTAENRQRNRRIEIFLHNNG
jgi:chemotaxis protein MotB